MCKNKKAVVWETVTCQYCHGKGEVLDGYDDMYGVVSTWWEECEECKGKGTLLVTEKDCKECGVKFKGQKGEELCEDCYRDKLLAEIGDDWISKTDED